MVHFTSTMAVFRTGAQKCWSGCVNECLRSHASGHVDVDVDVDVDIDLLLMLGTQKVLRNCCTPGGG